MPMTLRPAAMARAAGANPPAVVRTPSRLAYPRLTAVIFFFVLAIYLLVPVKDYFFDGIEFAQTNEDSRGLNLFLFHPNHLLYTATGYAMYRAAHALGIPVRALTLEVLFNTLVSALTAALMFQVLLAISQSAYLSTVLALAFAFSATWWRYSPNADAYIPAVFFLLLSCFLLLPDRRSRPLALAITHACAMLFHQLAVMFYPVAVAGLLLQHPDLPLETRVRNAMKYTVVAAAIVIFTYSFVFRVGLGRFRLGEFMHWLTSHDPAVGFEFNFGRSLSYTIHGTAQLLFATKASLLGHDLFSRILLSLATMLAGASVFQLARHRDELRSAFASFARADRRLLLLTILWIAVYLGFLFFWVPANQHYRPFYAAPIILLAAVIVAPAARIVTVRRRYSAALLVGAFALLNLALLILPLSREENTPTLAFAHQMTQFWPRGTVVFYQNYIANVNNWNMRYFNPQTDWRKVEPGTLPVSDSELRTIYNSGGTAWFDTSLLELPQWRTPPFEAWLQQHTRPGSLHEIPSKGWDIRFLQIFPPR